MAQLQVRVLKALAEPNRAALRQQLEGRNLEQALSRLRRISALLVGEQQVDGLTAASAATLDTAVCQAIVDELDIGHANLEPVYRLAAWIARTNYLLPFELFTVNYDLLLETALERLRVPYFDGFIGQLRARFQTELVEASSANDREWVPAFFARLWKLHGSVNWAWEDDKQIVRLGQPVSGGKAAAIYPSDAKYDESRRVPFVVLQDRLRRSLYLPESLMIISGYSFSDDHLNETIFDAAARRERSEIIAFCYSDIPTALAERAATTPNLQVVSGAEAILGGRRAEWKPAGDLPETLWKDGSLALRDFAKLAAFLSLSSSHDAETDQALRELLTNAGTGGGPAGGQKSG